MTKSRSQAPSPQNAPQSEDFTKRVITVLKSVPVGKVATYGQIAFLAGNPYGARQIAWILNSCSKKEKLPWHRIVNGKGKISLGEDQGYEEQMFLLKREGVEFDRNGKIDFSKYLWRTE